MAKPPVARPGDNILFSTGDWGDVPYRVLGALIVEGVDAETAGCFGSGASTFRATIDAYSQLRDSCAQVGGDAILFGGFMSAGTASIAGCLGSKKGVVVIAFGTAVRRIQSA